MEQSFVIDLNVGKVFPRLQCNLNWLMTKAVTQERVFSCQPREKLSFGDRYEEGLLLIYEATTKQLTWQVKLVCDLSFAYFKLTLTLWRGFTFTEKPARNQEGNRAIAHFEIFKNMFSC